MAARAVCTEWLEHSKAPLVIKAVIDNEQAAFDRLQGGMLPLPQPQMLFNFTDAKNVYHAVASKMLEVPLEMYLYSRIRAEQKAQMPDHFPTSSPVNHCLSLAFEKGDMDSAQTAINLGANAHIFDGLNFQSALCYADQKPFLQILIYLKNLGAQITFKDQNEILDEAFKIGDVDMVFDMMNLGAVFNEAEKKELPLMSYGGRFALLPLDDGYSSADSVYSEELGLELLGEGE